MPGRHNPTHGTPTTLGEAVLSLQVRGLSDEQVVATLSSWVRTGRLRLTGRGRKGRSAKWHAEARP